MICSLPADLQLSIFEYLNFYELKLVISLTCRNFRAVTLHMNPTLKCQHSTLVQLKLCNCAIKHHLVQFCHQLMISEKQPTHLLKRVLELNRVFTFFGDHSKYSYGSKYQTTMIRLFSQNRRSLLICHSFYFLALLTLLGKEEKTQLKLLKFLYSNFAIFNKIPNAHDWKKIYTLFNQPSSNKILRFVAVTSQN
jgi:hypothetical protein